MPGHQAAAQGTAAVVAEREGYVISEKKGHAGEIVESLDQRTADDDTDEISASGGKTG